MDLDDVLNQLAGLSKRDYSYAFLAALAGPLTLRLFGFKLLARLVRPLALLMLLGGMYAKQQERNAAQTRAQYTG